jgi:predicted Fe-S protein YdhL (DUF1289 family)
MATPSPCTKICRLDSAGVCVGCYRNRDEIAVWSTAGEPGRRMIAAAAASRRLHATAAERSRPAGNDSTASNR